MWGWEIKTCTQILHREYTSRDIAHAQWRFALVRHFGAEYIENGWRYTLGHNGGRIGNGVWGVEWPHDRWRHVTPKGQGRDPDIGKCKYLKKGWEIKVWYQLTTNRKWHMANRMHMWPVTSRDLERSRSWPNYVWGLISRKRLEIHTWSQWRTNRKWGKGGRMATWAITSRDPKRSRSWPNYVKMQISWKRWDRGSVPIDPKGQARDPI